MWERRCAANSIWAWIDTRLCHRPKLPGSQCNAPDGALYANITLRNITINSPKQSAGVLIANMSTPMQNITFDNVVVNNMPKQPWGDGGYYCKNVNGVATGTTSPVPPCFHDKTDRALANASGN